ncbi:ABC transporter permease [Clostridium sp.]|uniref:ABC transporter permease n=1 Tax=Clostridium sp. TaxID=1506 RepID=UPI002FC743AE
MDGLISFLAAAVVSGTPLLFATLGGIMNEKVGNLNLGIEGMMLMGAVMGFMTAVKTNNVTITIIVAALAGALGALVYAFLTTTLKSNQVVTGLTLTIFGTGFSSMVGKGLIGLSTPENIKAAFSTMKIPVLGDIPFIGPIFFNQDLFVYFGYIVTILLFVYFSYTSFGLNTKAVGENPYAADSASINVNLYKYINIILGGLLCGIGGAYLSLVYVPAWQEGVTAGRGWIAVALVIFSAWKPQRAILGAYIFGGLDILGFRLQGIQGINISQYLIDMIPYVVTIIVLVVTSMNKNSKNKAPAALGISYFREER